MFISYLLIVFRLVMASGANAAQRNPGIHCPDFTPFHQLMLATRLDSHIIYRHQKPSEIVCVTEIIKVGRNFHTILVVVAGLQTAPSKSTSFESASHFRLCDYSMIVGMARSDPITLAAAVQRCFCCKSRNIRGLHFVSPFGTPILLLANGWSP
jgi:hypothetical protein